MQRNSSQEEHMNEATQKLKSLEELSSPTDEVARAAPSIPPPPGWPEFAEEALSGLAGEIVKTIDPYTEADRLSVLVQLLAAFGNLVGPSPHFRVEFTQHPARLFAVLVGETSKGRKGQSWSTPKHLLSQVDPPWAKLITSGLSSGEGLIYAVRDPDASQADLGVTDKRLFVLEEEFAQPLKVMSREGNILSVTIREAWDHGDLHPLTKNNRVKATGAHLGIVGHITRDELLRLLNQTEQANGFANRFLWFAVRRSKVIPNPTGVPANLLQSLSSRLSDAAAFAKQLGEVKRDFGAEVLWAEIYPRLSEGKPGLLGAVLGRAEAQVMRIAMIYALLDQSAVIRPVDLKAALALWDCSESSVRWVFGDKLGDHTADTIVKALRERKELSETDIHGLFNRHVSAHEMDRALELIRKLGLAQSTPEQTGGRLRIVWRLAN
jgi:hypothetical protein